jgi:hypothetical protein
MLYFGCWNGAGHFLHTSDGRSVYPDRARMLGCPFTAGQLDGLFTPRNADQKEEDTELVHVHGWTVLAMWDRSVDNRPGSNAAFLMPGMYDRDLMWTAAERIYPQIVRRLRAFGARQAGLDGQKAGS